MFYLWKAFYFHFKTVTTSNCGPVTDMFVHITSVHDLDNDRTEKKKPCAPYKFLALLFVINVPDMVKISLYFLHAIERQLIFVLLWNRQFFPHFIGTQSSPVWLRLLIIYVQRHVISKYPLPSGAYEWCSVSPEAWSPGNRTRVHSPSFRSEACCITHRRSSLGLWEDGAFSQRYSRYVRYRL
jgi:hypothetical protein